MSNGNKTIKPTYYQLSDALEIQKKFDSGINPLYVADMGFGKTVVGCMIIKECLKKIGNDGYVLVCAPRAEILKGWKQHLETEIYGYEDMASPTKILDSKNFNASTLPLTEEIFMGGTKVILITYSILCSKFTPYGKNGIHTNMTNVQYFLNKKPALIIFDEIHNITNSADNEKKKLPVILSLLSAKYVLGLTATPVVNVRKELGKACKLLNPQYPMQNDKAGEDDFQIPVEFILSSFLKYNETQTNSYIVKLPLGDFERDRFGEGYFGQFDEGKNPLTLKPKVSYFLLRGDCEKDTDVLPDDEVSDCTSKLLAVRTILEKIPEHDKVLLFDMYHDNLDFLYEQKWIKKYNPVKYYVRADDCTDKSEIKKILNKHNRKQKNESKEKLLSDSIEKFETDSNVRLLLTTMKMSGEGVNLHMANHVIITSLSWTAKDIFQAIGRIQRKGQTKPVFSYVLATTFGDSDYDELLNAERKNIEILYQKNDEGNFKDSKNKLPERSLPPEKIFRNSRTLQKKLGTWIDDLQKDYVEYCTEQKKLIAETIDVIKQIINDNTMIDLFLYDGIIFTYKELQKKKKSKMKRQKATENFIVDINLANIQNKWETLNNILNEEIEKYLGSQKKNIIFICYILMRKDELDFEILLNLMGKKCVEQIDSNIMMTSFFYFPKILENMIIYNSITGLFNRQSVIECALEYLLKGQDIPDYPYHYVVSSNEPIEKLRQALMKNQPEKKPAIVVVKKKHAIKPTQKTHHTTQQKN